MSTDPCHTLVSFLGRANYDPVTGYRRATYRFSDGSERGTAYFGLALAEELRPNQLVLLGTCGSMWGVLVEHLAVSGQDESLRLELLEASDKATVTDHLLAKVGPLVERALGLPCTLRLIPYGRDSQEQTEILRVIADAVPKGQVSLDVTHGFRHLAAVGLLSAFFLEGVTKLHVAGIYYGALEMKDPAGITPVIRLDGLLSIQNWVAALERFDQSGDYGVFFELLKADGVPEDKARCLQDAAFYERTFNLAKARERIQTVLPALDSLRGVAALFRDDLKKRLSWVRAGDLMDHQRRLAEFYLGNGDFVRAAIFAFEAVVSRECKSCGLDPLDFRPQGARDSAIKNFDSQHEAAVGKSFRMLKNLRNALAHGNPASHEQVRRIVTSRELLHAELRSVMTKLLDR